LFDGWRRPSWIRTVSRDFASGVGGFATGGCGGGGKLMRTVSSFDSFRLAIGGIKDRKSCSKNGLLSPAKCIFSKKSAFFCSPRILGQKIVSAASSDPAPNEFTDRRRFGQDNARIDIRGVTFAPGDMRLIDQ